MNKTHNFELNIKRIKEIRIKNNISQKDLATKTNIKPSNLANYENEIELIPIKQFNVLCNYLKISFDYALNLSNKNTFTKVTDLDPILIGKRLKSIRQENNLYQETLAQEIGTSHSLISEYEKGKKLLSLPYGYAICKKYNISMDYIFGKSNKKNLTTQKPH